MKKFYLITAGHTICSVSSTELNEVCIEEIVHNLQQFFDVGAKTSRNEKLLGF
jgi:hypothetical protein